MKVLITRPLPDAQAFAALCEAAGLEPVICPLMRQVFHDREPNMGGVGALAFTSANGVRAFVRVEGARALPTFAVGEATAKEAGAACFQNVFIAGGDVSSLSQLVDAKRHGFAGDVLHIAGTHQAGDLIGALGELGIPARREVIYEMQEAEGLPLVLNETLEAGAEGLWAPLFSPRTAALFVRLVVKAGLDSALKTAHAACLSTAVAEEASALKWKSIEIAKERNSASMVEMMAKKA
ncbi:MAG: hypothetical protein DHS20C05_11650 [Hyphococcus sp.]|nr:MAG: hypothetical protein DHS20C05_11650 [Marinicaulis sp.]